MGSSRPHVERVIIPVEDGAGAREHEKYCHDTRALLPQHWISLRMRNILTTPPSLMETEVQELERDMREELPQCKKARVDISPDNQPAMLLGLGKQITTQKHVTSV